MHSWYFECLVLVIPLYQSVVFQPTCAIAQILLTPHSAHETRDSVVGDTGFELVTFGTSDHDRGIEESSASAQDTVGTAQGWAYFLCKEKQHINHYR